MVSQSDVESDSPIELRRYLYIFDRVPFQFVLIGIEPFERPLIGRFERE